MRHKNNQRKQMLTPLNSAQCAYKIGFQSMHAPYHPLGYDPGRIDRAGDAR